MNNKILRNIYRFVPLLGLLMLVIVFILGYERGIFSSTAQMEAFLLPFGLWGILLFVVFQIVQVVVPILPFGVSSGFGMLMFGTWLGLLYSYVGIVIGSVLNFLITRRYGEAFIQAILSEKAFNRYMGWLDRYEKRFGIFFGICIALPVSPDDILCFLAGLSHMKFKKFLLIILLCKPISILVYGLFLSTLFRFIFHN